MLIWNCHCGLRNKRLLAGAEQFVVVSSVGADPASKNFYLRTKGEMERELSKLPFKALHILRPSLLIGKRAEFRLGRGHRDEDCSGAGPAHIWAAAKISFHAGGDRRQSDGWSCQIWKAWNVHL